MDGEGIRCVLSAREVGRYVLGEMEAMRGARRAGEIGPLEAMGRILFLRRLVSLARSGEIVVVALEPDGTLLPVLPDTLSVPPGWEG